MAGRRVALVWGEHPWSRPPARVGKLFSMGAVYRNLNEALRRCSEEVRAYDGGDYDAHLTGIDILIGDLYGHTFPFLERRAAGAADFRAVVLAHGNLPKAGDPLLVRSPELLRPGDGIVFTSQADRDIFSRIVDRHELVEALIPPPLDLDVFNPRTTNEDTGIRGRYGIPNGVPLLLYVGRHNIQKNLHDLLLLLREVRQSVPDAHLALVGETDDVSLAEFKVRNDDYMPRLEALAVELGVREAVSFCGTAFGHDLAALYRTTDVVVNLGFYHRENFGMAQAESQACGTPVVCSAWGGFRGVVVPNVTGFLVDALMTKNGIRVDWAGAADAAVGLLQDDALRARMAHAAAEDAAARFSIAVASQRLAEYFECLLAADARDGLALRPSALALAYERHARECGWFNPDPAADIHRPMYTGDDYEIYEELVGPYASAVVSGCDTHEIDDQAVPVRAAPWVLESDNQVLRSRDFVWPDARVIPEGVAWRLVKAIDDRRSVAELSAIAGVSISAARQQVASLYRDGLIVLRGARPR